MSDFLPIIIAIVAVLAFASVLIFINGRKPAQKTTPGKSKKNRAILIRDATKKLAHDPHNVGALIPLSDLYYNEHLWDKALPLYELLSNLTVNHPEINPEEVYTRLGISSFKLNKFENALRSLTSAYKLNSSNFEINFYLGKTCYALNLFDKAIPCFRKALAINAEALGVNGPLGLSYYKSKRYKESLVYLRKALNEDPENKEMLFSMALAMSEANYGDKALKIFMHLRPDPEFGARSSLEAGLIHMRMNQLDSAAQDFEIGLKLKDVPVELTLEINYRAAACYMKMNKISNGLACLNTIQNLVPNYKDVNALVQRYKELNQNTNLQLYLTAGTSDFVAICRKLVSAYHSKSFIKFLDIAVAPDNVEITCEVETTKWESTQIYRFYRSTGSIGELYIRDFHGKIKDTKCDRGYCITPGLFSDEARKYTEGRPIDLVEKAQLMRLLKMINLVG